MSGINGLPGQLSPQVSLKLQSHRLIELLNVVTVKERRDRRSQIEGGNRPAKDVNHPARQIAGDGVDSEFTELLSLVSVGGSDSAVARFHRQAPVFTDQE